MQDTPVPSFFAALSAQEHATLFTDAHVRTLQTAFVDPRPAQTPGPTLRFSLIRTNQSARSRLGTVQRAHLVGCRPSARRWR